MLKFEKDYIRILQARNQAKLRENLYVIDFIALTGEKIYKEKYFQQGWKVFVKRRLKSLKI